MTRIKILSRYRRKYGMIWEAEVNGIRLCRKDGSPRRFGSYDSAEKAALKYCKTLAWTGELKWTT